MRLIVGLIVAVLVGVGGYGAWQTSIAADVGAAAIAKVTCSCVFVEGRPLESCRADDPPGFEDVSVTVDAKARTATGSVAGVVIRRAVYTEAYGCTLEP
ncbi:MAG: hypothetical protein ACKVRO_11005 [Micropepsaceae bacterium]